MNKLSRRKLLKSALSGATAVAASPSLLATSFSKAQEIHATTAKRPHQAICLALVLRKIELDELCKRGAEMGLKAIDLLEVAEWDVPAVTA